MSQQFRKFSLLEYFYHFLDLTGEVVDVSCKENEYILVRRHGRLVTLSRSAKVRFSIDFSIRLTQLQLDEIR